jgi:hypothetical protein
MVLFKNKNIAEKFYMRVVVVCLAGGHLYHYCYCMLTSLP